MNGPKRINSDWAWPLIAFGAAAFLFGAATFVACRFLEDEHPIHYPVGMGVFVIGPALVILGMDSRRGHSDRRPVLRR
jgi:hypothetical protein